VDRISREIVRLAESLGVEKPKVMGGDPHARLTGTYKGKALKMVVSTSKGMFDRPRGKALNKSNIKRELRRLDGQAVCGGYRHGGSK
jgi:hypothetical protein